MKTQTTINIDGMTCNGCVNSVTNALNQVVGIDKVDVSLADNNAVISYDAKVTDLKTLTEAIEDAGYDVVS